MDIKSYLMQFYINTNGEKLSPELAEMLVKDMAVTDGSARANGEKWSMAECTALGDSIGLDWEKTTPCEWYVVMNMIYSDYCPVIKKYSLPEPQIYADLSMAWIFDVDGKPNKTFRYFFS